MRQPQEPAFLDVFERRLRLEGLLTTRTGLHIGAGGGGDPIGTDLPVVRDGLGRPMIPGASLKGVMRSAAEALLRHFPRPAEPALTKQLWTCDIVGKDPCVSHGQLKDWRKSLPPKPEAKDLRGIATDAWKNSCTVCRLFGSMAMASRVRFPDLLLVGDRPQLELRNGVGIDRDRAQAARGVLYDFEAVPPETCFDLAVVADNYDDFEIGLLLYLFDELNRGSLVLGGKTSRGLGQVAVEWKRIDKTALDPSRVVECNPFADLLRRTTSRDAGGQAGPAELPLPENGDRSLWRQLADRLDGLERVDKHDVGQIAQEMGLTKADAASKLGVDGGRKTWASMISALTDCGRLVEKDGQAVPRARLDADKAAADDGAHVPSWLRQDYEKYLTAMSELWQRQEAA